MVSKLAQLRAQGLVIWLHAALDRLGPETAMKDSSGMEEGKSEIYENNSESSQFILYYPQNDIPKRQTDVAQGHK